MQAVVLLLLVAVASAKVYDRCELARTLKAAGMDGYRGVSLADWVCLSKWESNYNTFKISANADGSTDYGIFQISSRRWCEDRKTPRSKNGCGIDCNAMMSNNLQAAITCAKRVVRDPKGIRAWEVWRRHCERKDLSSYTAGCGV